SDGTVTSVGTPTWKAVDAALATALEHEDSAAQQAVHDVAGKYVDQAEGFAEDAANSAASVAEVIPLGGDRGSVLTVVSKWMSDDIATMPNAVQGVAFDGSHWYVAETTAI